MKRKLSFAAIMGIITTGIISLAVMLINTNLVGVKLMTAWLKSWGVAYIIVIPCILIFSPLVERILNKIYK